MKLAPRMIQAMEILQLPLMALQERIETELTSNPVLEMHDAPAEGDVPDAGDDIPAEVPHEQPLVVRDETSQADDFRRLDAYEYEYETDVWNGDSTRAPRGEEDAGDRKLDAMANAAAPEQSLQDYLLEQWLFVDAPQPVARAGEMIIEAVGDDGYLRESLEELQARNERGLTIENFREALRRVHRLDPVGVAARDLRECLLLQLQARQQAGEDVKLRMELVRSFLRDIEMNRLPQIARKTGQDVETIKHAIEQLSHLNPRPGLQVGQRPTPTIVPDIVVELDEEGEVIIGMTDKYLPTLQINREYATMARDRRVPKEAKEFLQRNIRSAEWLITAIEQRRDTVRRVAAEVFLVQRDFLEKGPAALKPLPMTDIAEKVEVHVATVSRAVAGKYVQTPRGIFPLRMFFSGGTKTEQGQDMAWDAVKAKLREIIDNEDKSKPLSDDQLVTQLKEHGIDIARRTVAKYRGLLDIPPARQRRQY